MIKKYIATVLKTSTIQRDSRFYWGTSLLLVISALCNQSDDKLKERAQDLTTKFDEFKSEEFTHFILQVEDTILIDIDKTLTNEMKKLFERTRKEIEAEEEKIIDVTIVVFIF